MDYVADVLLVAGALGAALYCHVLSRRLRRFTDLEKGVGGAVAVMSVQVDDLTKALADAREGARLSAAQLEELNLRAEAAQGRLEVLLASLHDLPPSPSQSPTQRGAESPFFVARQRVAEGAE